MSATTTKDADGRETPAPGTAVQKILDGVNTLSKRLDAIEQKAATPVYPGGANPGQHFYAARGPLTKDSAGYSVLKAAGFAMGFLEADQAKQEIDYSNKLRALYGKHGFAPTHGRSFLAPFDTSKIPTVDQEGEKLAGELRQKMAADAGRFDPDEARWLNAKLGGMYTKALGTITDTAGGVLVGFPTLGELIDLQRNREVFTNAGASEIALPPNGRMQFPKLTAGATAYMVGESLAITESQETTGHLDLQAKKMGILVKLNNEAVRFVNPSMEGLVRTDMGRVGALKIDQQMLEGTGGTSIKGLLLYDTATSWTQNTDKLLAYTVTSNLFQPKDAANMEALLPDAVDAPTAWVMRKNMWGVIVNRRADAVTTSDGAGPFVFNLIRQAGDKPAFELYGTKVVRSSQVSNTRGTGAQTYIVLGYFPDWIIARFGVMEFLSSNVGDTPLVNDQTWLRAIQHVDAGARHAASFVLADAITIS